jgi:HlyD family secretion protein
MAGRRLARLFAAIAIVVAIGAALWVATRPPGLTVQGEVNATRADVSARVSGRVHELMADVGDTVERGAIIARLESPQLEASFAVAEAALVTAQADLEQINMTRPQAVAAVIQPLVSTQPAPFQELREGRRPILLDAL